MLHLVHVDPLNSDTWVFVGTGIFSNCVQVGYLSAFTCNTTGRTEAQLFCLLIFLELRTHIVFVLRLGFNAVFENGAFAHFQAVASLISHVE